MDDGATYRRSCLPMNAVLTADSLRLRPDGGVRSAFLGGARFFRSGRAALAFGLKALGVGQGDRILVPAYHCVSLVEAALWTGAEIDFYRVRPDLRADIGDVERKWCPKTRAILVVHFFGFPQPLEALDSLRRDRSLRLVEDCAHAFFGEVAGALVGSSGDLSIASARKFFPVDDGGMLIGSSAAEHRFRSTSLREELRALARILDEAGRYRRLRPLSSMVRSALSIRRRQRSLAASEPPRPGDFRSFSAGEMEHEATGVSKWIVRHSHMARVVARRRRRFERLLEELGGLRGGQPLHEELPAGVVPYMFPLLLNTPATDFARLKEAGVPMLRWEEVAYSDCPVSEAYVERLVQIPCHQTLREEELDWMVSTLKGHLG